jgi:hypothetical protein
MTAVLVVTLAPGIGVSTMIFRVVNSVVIRPLPYRDPDRGLVMSELSQLADGLRAERWRDGKQRLGSRVSSRVSMRR